MIFQNQDVTLAQGVGAGLKFRADKSNRDCRQGTYELPLQKALQNYLKPEGIFYDIGANIGFFTVIAAKLVGTSGHVYAFEPVPENAARISENIKLNEFSNVTLLEKAVSQTTGSGELLLAHHHGGATLSSAGTPPDLKGEMTVDLVCIDDLVLEKTLLPPTFVKIDVEGAEIEALRGMIQTLNQFKPIIIYEVDDGNALAFQRKSEEIATFIRTLGYEITPLEAAYPNIRWHVGHAIAIHPKMLPVIG